MYQNSYLLVAKVCNVMKQYEKATLSSSSSWSILQLILIWNWKKQRKKILQLFLLFFFFCIWLFEILSFWWCYVTAYLYDFLCASQVSHENKVVVFIVSFVACSVIACYTYYFYYCYFWWLRWQWWYDTNKFVGSLFM